MLFDILVNEVNKIDYRGTQRAIMYELRIYI